MKCQSCGSANAVSAKHCEYCGVSLLGISSQKQNAARIVGTTGGSKPAGGESLWPNLKDPIFHLWQLPPAHSIRWMAFLFPIAYLAGYGGERAALGLSGIFIVASIVAQLLHLMYYKAAWLFTLIFIVIQFIYCYKVAVHADNLVPLKGEFNWVKGIAFQLLYIVIAAILI